MGELLLPLLVVAALVVCVPVVVAALVPVPEVVDACATPQLPLARQVWPVGQSVAAVQKPQRPNDE